MLSIHDTEFCARVEDYLGRVEKGEHVRIHRRGKAVALLIPATHNPVSRWKTAPPLIRLKGKGPSGSQILIEERR